MRRILLPTDFSENSLNAIDYAVELYKNIECHFFLLNVQKSSEYIMDDLLGAHPDISVYDAIANDNKEQLAEVLSTYVTKSKNKGHHWHMLFDFDVFIDAIKQAVISEKIDLIIMGTNGASGAKETLFGSNTLNVVRNVNCPTLMIPEGFMFKTLSSVLLSATNCKDLKIESVEILKNLATTHNTLIHVLNIHKEKNEPDHGYDFYLKNIFDNQTYKWYALRGIPLPFAIESFEQLIPVDMHAMFIKKESFLDRFFFGSKTLRVSYGTRIPLLLLPIVN